LQEANRTAAEQTVAARQLAAEREALQQRISKLSASAEAAEGLRAENELLKQQLAQLKREAPPTSLVEENKQRTAEAEARVAALQSDADVLRLEKRALEIRLQKAASVPVTVPDGRAEDRQRIKQLEAERDEAQQKLAAVSQSPQPGSNQELAAKVEQLTQEIAGLRARLSVFEARTVPYSVDELALFKPSAPKLIAADSASGKKAVQPLPGGTTALAAEAQRHFAARQYDQAEAKYQDLLRQDEKNSATLANLARVQIENQRFDEAEKNIRLALTSAPNDGDNLFVLGYLKLQQKKYDEALDPLSRAVQINPNRAEIQNCLGVTLSHQGLRGPAETAFRKAIQIDPADANAHNNLAVMYAEQTPPLVELARWHYQKALAAGQPKNPDLEKILERKTVTPVK
jgi:tetratricopeptide (TPR) repeat protein